MKIIYTGLLLLSSAATLFGQQVKRTPIEVIAAVADKVVRTTPWRYTLDVAKQGPEFDFISVLDLERTYSKEGNLAYAWSEIHVLRDSVYSFDISHSAFCKVYVNGDEVYRNAGLGAATYQQMEREFKLSNQFKCRLKRGVNTIVLKVGRSATDWKFLLQPTG